MFQALPRPLSGAYNSISSLRFLTSERGDSSAVGRGLAGQTTTNNAATAALPR